MGLHYLFYAEELRDGKWMALCRYNKGRQAYEPVYVDKDYPADYLSRRKLGEVAVAEMDIKYRGPRGEWSQFDTFYTIDYMEEVVKKVDWFDNGQEKIDYQYRSNYFDLDGKLGSGRALMEKVEELIEGKGCKRQNIRLLVDVM